MSKESTGKRITDELRHNIEGAEQLYGCECKRLTEIADRIDAAHDKAIKSVMNDALYHANDKDMADLGWVRLPKDADGEYIHVGDVMDGIDKYNSLREVTGRVITISFEADGLVDVAVQARNDDGKSWRRAYLDLDASVYRHHHEPTVEDVLRDYASRILIAGCIDEEDTLVAEYAAKLRLTDNGKEQ